MCEVKDSRYPEIKGVRITGARCCLERSGQSFNPAPKGRVVKNPPRDPPSDSQQPVCQALYPRCTVCGSSYPASTRFYVRELGPTT